MDTMKYNHKELPLVPFSELKGKTYVIPGHLQKRVDSIAQ